MLLKKKNKQSDNILNFWKKKKKRMILSNWNVPHNGHGNEVVFIKVLPFL